MTIQDSSTSAPLVLVVDDEPRLRDMLLRSAQEMGFRSVGARSAEQAIRILEHQPVDILLLDLNLPGLDGMQLLERLHSRQPRPQVIILTGFGSLDAAQRAIRMDVVDFLTKPCPLDQLEVALARASQRLLRDPTPAPPPEPQIAPHATLDELERTHILAALDRHDGNRATAAAELGISERTLYYRLARYGCHRLSPRRRTGHPPTHDQDWSHSPLANLNNSCRCGPERPQTPPAPGDPTVR